MDATDPTPLRVWSLATFHAISFVAAVAAAGHLSGGLRASLARLETALGVAAFLGLWALTWAATRAGLVALGSDRDDDSMAALVMRLTVAGGWNGIALFGVLVLIALFNIASHGTATLYLVPVLLLVLVIGSALAFTIGGIVGFAYGLIDAVVLRGGAALFRWAQLRP